VPNVGAPNFIKHTLLDLKTQIDHNKVVAGDFNTCLSPVDRSSRQKLNKETLELNDTIDLIDLTDVYRVFHTATAQYTFFSAAHGTFFKTDSILGHKASLNKYEKIELTLCTLSDHNTMKLEFNNKRRGRKYSNNWQLNNTFFNDQWEAEEIREEIKKFLEFNENENIIYQSLWDKAKAVLKGKFIAMSTCIKNTER
jgi:hypothetical protein